jgi:hypothetical protein
MNRLTLPACLGLLLGAAPAGAQEARKPNIVFILADNDYYASLERQWPGECKKKCRNSHRNSSTD